MKNVRNSINVRLVSNKKDCLKWTSKQNYMSQKIFDNNLAAIHKNKVTLTLNKPAYLGMRILDFSKKILYEFYYDYIKNKYRDNSRLVFTDTDSLMYGIRTEDNSEDFSKDQ